MRNCATEFSMKDNVSIQTEFDYRDGITLTSIADRDTFFKFIDETQCQMTECKLMNAECQTDYIDSGLFVGSIKPWTLSINPHEVYGKNFTVCYQCTNALQKIQYELALT